MKVDAIYSCRLVLNAGVFIHSIKRITEYHTLYQWKKKKMFKTLHVINIKTLKALTKSKILKAMFRYFE